MSALVSWVNPNNPSTLMLYRSDSPIDQQNLPAPLVTLTSNEQSYLDATAPLGGQVYYLLKVEADGKSAFSRELNVRIVPDTGPGPQELLWGDLFLGFYGVVNDYEVGFPVSNWYNSAPDSRYFKIAYRGRILYVGAPVINTGKNATALEAANLLRGGITPLYGPEAPAPTRVVGFRQYYTRIAKLYDYNNTLVESSSYSLNFADGMPFGQSEFLDLYRIMVRALARSSAAPFRFAHSTFASSVPTITSDYGAANRSAMLGWATVPNASAVGLGIVTVGLTSANNSFIPIMELFQE